MKEETAITGIPREPQSPSEPKNKVRKGWRYKTPPDLTQAQETVFLNMALRKTDRSLSGAKSRNTNYEFVALAILLIILYSFGSREQLKNEDVSKDAVVVLSLGQVLAIGVWLFVAAFVSATLSQSRFIVLLSWVMIYLPLIAMMVSFLFAPGGENYNQELYYMKRGAWIGILLLITQILAIAIFVGIFYFFPKYINSQWFRKNRMAAHFWKIKIVGDWTMTYRSAKYKRHTCKYQGDTNKYGLPHGIGRWYDDSIDGEILTGTWKDGVPVAPFFSRHYGRGDVFSAVRIAYVMASDDSFTSNKFWPSNKNPTRCGIASVECSVSGHFYNELPRAFQLVEETPLDENTSIEHLCRDLKHIGEEDDGSDMLHIKANDPRGVQIPGYVHSLTGKTFEKVEEILIKVRPDTKAGTVRRRPKLEYMPFSKSHLSLEKVVERDQDDSVEAFIDESGNISALESMPPIGENEEVEAGNTTYNTPSDVKLEIQNWIPAKHKDALVFLAGFNCGLQKGLNGFGQFIAMTKLDSVIYPILYGWPCGTLFSYPSASRAALGEQNRRNFCSLIKSLRNAGIRNVHFMSHSMGAQTLLGSFRDLEDGSRSEASRLFKLAPGWEKDEDEDKSHIDNESDDDRKLLVCKTFTLLNPDFPLDPFVHQAFRSVRRICDAVTVVGDSTDTALYFSQLMNGIGVYFGYKQPPELLPNTRNKKQLGIQPVIGKSIEKLYLPVTLTAEGMKRRSLLFSERAPVTVIADDEDMERSWLDLDVIDTSGLDTNIANIRHSAFNLNPVLLNDLEELVRTSHRAMKRTSLLYRDGNLFSYCHAPSYVSY